MTVSTCQHCGYEAPADATTCPLCGAYLAGEAPARAEAPVTVGAPSWETGSASTPAFVDALRNSMFRPSAFFEALPYQTSLARPILYYLLIAVISAFFALIWQAVGFSYGYVPAQAGYQSSPIVEFFLSPFAALLGLLVGSLLLHLFVMLLVRGRRTLGATARVYCYAWGPSVLTIAPLLGPPVGLVWSIVLLIIGVRAAHRTTPGRAAAVVLVPLGLAVLLVATLFVLVFLFGLATGELLRL